MARRSYNLDGLQFGDESTYGTAPGTFTVDMGFPQTCTVNVEDEVRQVRTMTGGSDGILPQANVDLMHRVSGTLTVLVTDLKQLQYFLGDYTEPAGYVINPSSTVDSLTIRGSYDSDKALQVTGVVFRRATMRLAENDILTITYDFVAKEEEEVTATPTYTAPSDEPLTFLEGSATFNSQAWKIDEFSLDMNFDAEGRRNIESVSAGDERLITEVIKKNFSINWDVTCDLEDIDNEHNIYAGGGSTQANRSDFSIVLTMTDDNSDDHVMTVTGVRGTNFTKEWKEDGEVKKFSSSGVALDVQATGVV